MNRSVKAAFIGLDRLLEKERTYLISGDLEALKKIPSEKKAFLERIAMHRSNDEPGLASLLEKLERNQRLLRRSIEGVQVVADKMRELHRVQIGFDSYDRVGHKTRIARTSKGKLEKRA